MMRVFYYLRVARSKVSDLPVATSIASKQVEAYFPSDSVRHGVTIDRYNEERPNLRTDRSHGGAASGPKLARAQRPSKNQSGNSINGESGALISQTWERFCHLYLAKTVPRTPRRFGIRKSRTKRETLRRSPLPGRSAP